MMSARAARPGRAQLRAVKPAGTSDSIFAPRNAKQASPVQPLQRMGCRFRIAAPRIHNAALAQVGLQSPGMRLAQLLNEVEHLPFERARRRCLSGCNKCHTRFDRNP